MAVVDRAWVTAVRFLVLFAVTVEWRMNLGAAWSLGDEVGYATRLAYAHVILMFNCSLYAEVYHYH